MSFVFCFRGFFGLGLLKSNLHIFIIPSCDMEVGQGKLLSYSYYADTVQINQCGILRRSIGGIRFAILFL